MSDGTVEPLWIDIHAHLFNGFDLPVGAFMRNAYRPTRKPAIDRAIGALLECFATPSPPPGQDIHRIVCWLLAGGADIATDALAPETPPHDFLWARAWRYTRMFNQARIKRTTMLANLDHLCSEVVVGCADTYPIDLYVPLCVDLESGAGGEARATPLQQFEVMEWLSSASLLGRIPGFDGVVLPMVGFDPRRDGDWARSSFRAVQDRVRRGAAIGVKLYPPMGFRPLGNERAVDARLHELYEWCVDERVPIVAHCSPANAVRGADDAAHPHGWRPVLERYPTLHLGLAHAGGIEKTGWSSAALDLVRDFLHDGHVYADVSNHDHIGRGRQFLEEVAAKACHTGWGFTGRLMFGTDFWFLYMHRDIEHFLSDYARDIVGLLAMHGIHERVQGGAAQEFLGFHDLHHPNRIRVEQRVELLRRVWGEAGPGPMSLTRLLTVPSEAALPAKSRYAGR